MMAPESVDGKVVLSSCVLEYRTVHIRALRKSFHRSCRKVGLFCRQTRQLIFGLLVAPANLQP